MTVSTNLLHNLVVVLVGTQGNLNLGSVARSLGNFGVRELRLTAPEADPASDEARRMAVSARPLLEQARRFDELRQAVADCHLVIGTSRRTGKYRVDPLEPSDAAELLFPQLAHGRVALVFGREDHGLSASEVELCQRVLEIPTDDAVPSMNLAQAVSICLYECYKLAQKNAAGFGGDRRELATGDELEAMFQHMRRTLLDIEFLDPQNPDHILRALRSILGRAALDPREVRILQGLLSRVDWVEGERQRSQGG
ncbi:MAG: RNA methyltransferase [Desulfuromonas sp.]|nr:MAG: RNA methyltransferase [Desulfuromonas sp.]